MCCTKKQISGLNKVLVGKKRNIGNKKTMQYFLSPTSNDDDFFLKKERKFVD